MKDPTPETNPMNDPLSHEQAKADAWRTVAEKLFTELQAIRTHVADQNLMDPDTDGMKDADEAEDLYRKTLERFP